MPPKKNAYYGLWASKIYKGTLFESIQEILERPAYLNQNIFSSGCSSGLSFNFVTKLKTTHPFPPLGGAISPLNPPRLV